ncbi:MAG: HEAT repeat domain-containing protein [Planctomycetota bacterium]
MSQIKLVVIISVILALAVVAALVIFNLRSISHPASINEAPVGTPPIKPAQETQPIQADEHRSDRDSEPEGAAAGEPKGPFPIDESVPEKERRAGRLFNLWRKAILTRNITQINQLETQVKGYGDNAIPFLRKLAKEDGNERVRAFSVRVLGRMNIPDLSTLFVELLRDDQSPFVRENSCWALGRLGNPEAIEILQKTADADQSTQVRKAATEAIESIRSSSK